MVQTDNVEERGKGRPCIVPIFVLFAIKKQLEKNYY
jgi:hypothetical protein